MQRKTPKFIGAAKASAVSPPVDSISVHLIRHKTCLHKDFTSVLNILMQFDGGITLLPQKTPLLHTPEAWTWDSLFTAMNEWRLQSSIPDADYALLLTATPNDHNWFGAFDSDSNNIFVQTSGWENFVCAEPKYPIAYEIVANVLQKAAYGSVNRILDTAHRDPLGCLNDICQWKPDIMFKLRTADICPDCFSSLSARLSARIVKQAVDTF